jgi:hypothetical protein
MEDLLYKYFRNDKIYYYNPSDAISNSHYIKYSFFKGQKDKVLITIGSNDGEVDVKIIDNKDDLDELIYILTIK